MTECKRTRQASRLPENPIRRMRIAARLLREQHGELAAWLEAAVQEHIQQGTDMDRALGFAGTLGRTPRFDVLRVWRNRLLSRALLHLHGDMRALHREVLLYLERVPEYLKDRQQPDLNWTAARRLIHRAHRQGLGLPATLDGLRKALRNMGCN